MARGYSSVVEQSAAVRQVPGLTPGVPLNFFGNKCIDGFNQGENISMYIKANKERSS